jgi:hypothetical protein
MVFFGVLTNLRKHENINISCGIDLDMIEFYKQVDIYFLDFFGVFNQIYGGTLVGSRAQY